MPQEHDIDEEPRSPSVSEDSLSSKMIKPYQKIKRDLSEEELGSSGAQKLLLSELDRLEEEVISLQQFRDDFHICDKEKAVLDEKIKSSVSKEILYSVVISLGATLIGIFNSLNVDQNNASYIVLIGGIVLIIGGVVSKFFAKWM